MTLQLSSEGPKKITDTYSSFPEMDATGDRIWSARIPWNIDGWIAWIPYIMQHGDRIGD